MKTFLVNTNLRIYFGIVAAIVFIFTCTVAITALPPADVDGDGVPDQTDNCNSNANPQRIVFTRAKVNINDPGDTNNDVYIMNENGSDITNLTPNTEDTEEVDAEFHPNGAKVVFATNRDGNYEIYTMNADGTGLFRVTNASGSDRNPSFRADGKKIVFSSDRDGDFDIYIMNLDGSNQTQLTGTDAAEDFDEDWPTFSPNGAKIAFSTNRDGNYEVYTLEVAAPANLVNLTNDPALDSRPDFRPDGVKIAFQSNRAGGATDVWVMDTDGSNPANLTVPLTFNSGPSYSPDGSRIAFRSDSAGGADIFAMDADGNNSGSLEVSASAGDFDPDWGRQPDSDGDGIGDACDSCPSLSKIAFSSLRTGLFQIYTMNSDGSDQTRLTFTLNGADTEPIFSKDGSKIIFNSSRDGDGEIYIMNSDGSNQFNLTNEPSAYDDFPIFSPDGTKIYFTSNRSGDYEIWRMNVDGTNPVNISNSPGTDVGPMLSPDGSKIAFTSARDGNTEIYIMNADGTGQTRLTNDPMIDSSAQFTPDGSKLLFSTTRDGNYEQYLMNLDGSNLVNVTNNPAHDADGRLSGDGSKLVFASTRSGDYEIWVANADGSNAVQLTHAPGEDFDPFWSSPCGIGATPTATTMDAPAATQYSDVVTLSSTTTANGVPVTTGSVEFFVNGVSVGADAVDSNGVANLNTQVLLAAGSYTVEAKYTASDAGLLDSTDTDSLTVTKEDASVTASANNAEAVKVNSPGGNAGPITLCANIGDAQDGSLGDISKAVPVTFVMAPVAPGLQLQQQDASLSSGTACVTFNNVPVNVYDVSITVGGNFYTGSGSTVLIVYDPSLGFTTGGGRVVNSTTGNTLHFGFSFKYDKKTFKGQMIVMEHTANGVVKLKSNSLTGMSVVGTQAIVQGKANITNGSGNLVFRLNVIDNGEPGVTDKFGLTVTNGGVSVPAFTIDPPKMIAGGNIQVPQGARK
jgi:Tol biopolymer transport system component